MPISNELENDATIFGMDLVLIAGAMNLCMHPQICVALATRMQSSMSTAAFT